MHKIDDAIWSDDIVPVVRSKITESDVSPNRNCEFDNLKYLQVRTHKFGRSYVYTMGEYR